MRRALPWLLPVVALGVAVGALTLFTAPLVGHRYFLGATASLQFVLNTNASALTSAMSVLIALVLLSVHLTAQRYSFNIIDIFIRSWVNAALIGLFILTINFNLWLASTLNDDATTPGEGTILAMAMTTVCFALLPPYVVHLFDVLRPNNILNHLQRRFLEAIDVSPGPRDLEPPRAAASERISQMGDIARTAVNLSDSAVANHSVWVLYWSVERYGELKPKLPGEWFAVSKEDFRGRHELVIREIEETRTWLERCMLDELQEVFYATLNRMHDVNNTVVQVLRLLGEKAIERDDLGLLQTVVKFFNTFLRATINQADARAGYHALYQYRLLADAALGRRPDVALEIADRLNYYGDAAAGGPLLWMSAAAAYDLRMLAERSHGRCSDPAIAEAIVDNLLDSVRRAEAKRSPALHQLHKTVAALGSFFLTRGDRATARRLRAALADLPEATLSDIGRDLAAVEDDVFWELTDRVVNFDYVDDDARAALPHFLQEDDTWEPSPPASPPTAASSAHAAGFR